MKVLGNYPSDKKIGDNIDLNPSIFIWFNLPVLWEMVGLQPTTLNLQFCDKDDGYGIFIEEDGILFINNWLVTTNIIAIRMKGGNVFGALWGMMGEYVRSVYVKQAPVSPEDYLDLDVSRRAGLAHSYVDEVEAFLQTKQHQPHHKKQVDSVVVAGIVNAFFTTADIDGRDVDDAQVKSIITAKNDWVNPKPFRL